MTIERHGELMRRVQGGDEAAWSELVDELGGLVWSVTRSYALNRDDALEVAQTVWLRLATSLERIHDPGRVGLWLMTTTRRECSRALSRRRNDILVDPVTEFSTYESGSDVEGDVVDGSRRAVLWQCVEEMGQPCQSLIRAFLCDPPPSYADVAEALGVAPGTVGPMRQRCLQQLRSTAIAEYEAM